MFSHCTHGARALAGILIALPLLAACGRGGSRSATTAKAPVGIPIGKKVTGQPLHVVYAHSLVAMEFTDGDLGHADLAGKDLTRSNLHGTNLNGADLRKAILQGADLSATNLSGADLLGADLRKANLAKADLSGAYLQRANLTGAKLAAASLTGTRYDRRTRWPAGFDPQAHSAILDE